MDLEKVRRVIPELTGKLKAIVELEEERRRLGQERSLIIKAEFVLTDQGAFQFEIAETVLAAAEQLSEGEVIGEVVSLGLMSMMAALGAALEATGEAELLANQWEDRLEGEDRVPIPRASVSRMVH